MADDVENVETDDNDGSTSSASVSTVLTDDVENQDSGEGSETTGDDSTGDSTGGEGSSDGEEGNTGEGDDVVPETYADFNLPEGLEINSDILSEVTPLLKEVNATQGQAQKLVDWYANQVQASEQKQVDTFNQLMNDWGEQSKNDSEFGGDKFVENVKIAQAAITRFGTPELKQLMKDHGVGNHPEMVRFMVRVGHTIKEDVPGNAGANTSQSRDRVSILYPSDK